MKLAKHAKAKPVALAPVRREQPPFWPFSPLSRLHREIDQLFAEPFGGWLAPAAPFVEGWAPAVDVYEDKDNFVVKAELPGMKKEDIDVSLHDGSLSISGERKSEDKHEDSEVYRSERFFGRFQRTLTLPAPVAADKVKAV